MKFERIVDFQPGFDKRSNNPSTNYGICGGVFTFVLKGPHGAIQFKFSAPFYPEHVFKEHMERNDISALELLYRPNGYDVGYHSPRPMYEGQDPICTDGSCPYVEGKHCYYDGSGLRADDWLKEFLAGGTEWLWPVMEAEYHARFNTDPEAA